MCHPDQSATSQLLSDLAFHTAAQGREVQVVTSWQRYGADSEIAQIITESERSIAVPEGDVVGL